MQYVGFALKLLQMPTRSKKSHKKHTILKLGGVFSDKILDMFDFFHTIISQLSNVFKTDLERSPEISFIKLKELCTIAMHTTLCSDSSSKIRYDYPFYH